MTLSRRLTFGNIEVEEVAVEHGLYASGNHSNQVEEALEVVAVDPVQDVQGTVWTQGKEIMRRDGLGLSGLADHKQLGQDGNGLQVDGECPQDLEAGMTFVVIVIINLFMVWTQVTFDYHAE